MINKYIGCIEYFSRQCLYSAIKHYQETAMGLFDQIAGVVGGGSESGANKGLMESALELIRNQEGGGLAGLL